MNRQLLISLLLVTAAQAISYFQLQSQFFSEWSRKNTLFMVLLGIPISYILLEFTRNCALAFNGETWPGRLIGFAVGAIVFAVLSLAILKEPFTLKTGVCLALAAGILCVQIFWK